MGRHVDLRPVWEGHVGALGEYLDEAEYVVPAAQVQAGWVFPQLVEDLLHLEGGENMLDEHGAADSSPGNIQNDP